MPDNWLHPERGGIRISPVGSQAYERTQSNPIKAPDYESVNQDSGIEPGIGGSQFSAMPDPTREEFDAKLETAAARTDTKFVQLIGKIDTATAELKGELGKIATRIDGVEKSTGGVKSTVVLAAIGAVAVLIAVLAYGQQWLGLGMTARDLIHSTVIEMHQQESAKSPTTP